MTNSADWTSNAAEEAADTNLRALCLKIIACLCLAVLGFVSGAAGMSAANSEGADSQAASGSVFPPRELSPGTNDGKIASTVATMLTTYHFLHMPFDTNISSKFFDLYINAYDPRHDYFTSNDLARFEPYRFTLNTLTLDESNTTPAYEIYNRFMQRLDERTAYANQALKSEDFSFDGSEDFSLNRKTAPWPANDAEAHKLWHERLRYDYLQEKLTHETPRELARLFTRGYNPLALAKAAYLNPGIVKTVEIHHKRLQRYYHDWESDKVLETYLTALANVYDPHSVYENEDSHANFEISMRLSLFGIGAVLTTDDDGYCKIVSLSPGMPAAKTHKLKPEDRIVAVAQAGAEPVDVVQMPLNKIVDMIRGPKGTEVRLTVIPASDPSSRAIVKVVRDEIKLEEQQAKAKLIETQDPSGHTNRLGVIDLPSFYGSISNFGRSRGDIKSASADVDMLIEKLKDQQMDGLILDLRHNPGGLLNEAIDLAGLFIRQGPVVQVKSIDGSVVVDEDHDPRVQYDGPLVVLIDRFSASASEIVAGALQDYGRAVLVGGSSTHGKGTVQTVIPLAAYLYMKGEHFSQPMSLGAFRYTTNKFYRITGSTTELKGVVPDIILPSTLDYLETDEGQLQYAIGSDLINPCEFDKLNRVDPFLPELKLRSDKRVAASKDYAYVREDVDIVKKMMAEKTVSMNERKRLKEAYEEETRKRARDIEIKSRPSSTEKVFNFTIKNGEVEMAEDKPATPKAGQPTVKDLAEPKPGDIEPDDEAAAKAEPAEPAAPEERAPLEEAEHILTDYIAMINGGQPVTAGAK
jgi:carboxyl-terminal processing protease